MKSFSARWIIVLACTTLSAAVAAGQSVDATRGPQLSTPAGIGPLLDAPVNRSEYRLGPGDVVDVAVFGEVSMLQTLAVTPEGTLVIPQIGVARVLGLNLDEAQSRVRALVFTYYRNVDVNLTLAQLRSFKVFVLGDVSSPGVRTASSATRVSEVVGIGDVRSCPTLATTPGPGQGDTRRQDGSRPQEPAWEDTALCPISPSDREPIRLRRNVLLRRVSGDSVLLDLARFALLGDLTANPTLMDGDALLVPPIDETVTVRGRVAFPGAYEFRAGETLAELLHIVTGGRGFPVNAADTVRVSRFRAGDERETLTISAAEAIGATGRAIPLQPFDAVYVPEIANFGIQYMATIRGQVARPGSYPIRPDTTTVRELVAMAGGFTPRASLINATLRRIPVEGLRRGGEELAPDSALSPNELRIARLLSQTDGNYVVLDFEQLFAVGAPVYDQPLQSGDLLTVPEIRNDVEVIGAVIRPGLLAHVPGWSVNQYVALAGGYSQRADWREAMVLRAATGTRLAAREVRSLEPGDRIVVPFREHRTVLERVQMTQSVIGIVSGAVLTVASIYALFR